MPLPRRRAPRSLRSQPGAGSCRTLQFDPLGAKISRKRAKHSVSPYQARSLNRFTPQRRREATGSSRCPGFRKCDELQGAAYSGCRPESWPGAPNVIAMRRLSEVAGMARRPVGREPGCKVSFTTHGSGRGSPCCFLTERPEGCDQPPSKPQKNAQRWMLTIRSRIAARCKITDRRRTGAGPARHAHIAGLSHRVE
jgi:hypothetical protein